MSYFSSYVKRINRYGNNLQSRIQGKREHDFLTFMQKSPNLVKARNNDEENYYEAVLQTKEYDQDEIVDYLLVPLDLKINMGTIIRTTDSRHEKERNWINYAIDPYTSTGYNRYTIVELESELSWFYEGVKYTSLAHATGGGSGARDKNINLKFKVQFSEAGVYLPNKRYSIVMPRNEHLKKNIKVTLGGETWRVAGFDNISVDGVSYVTLEEYLHDKIDDNPVANIKQLKDWSVTTDKGTDFILSNSAASQLKISFYYQNKLRENIDFAIIDNDNYSVEIGENGNIIITPQNSPVGAQVLKIKQTDWKEEDAIEIPFNFATRESEQITIIGPNYFFMGDNVNYEVFHLSANELSQAYVENKSIAKIINTDFGNNTLSIQGISIGNTKICIPDETNPENITEFPIEVRSIWLKGG